MMLGNNFNIHPFSVEDRLFLIGGGTVDMCHEAKRLSKNDIIDLDDTDMDFIREIHSKALHFLDCNAQGEVFSLCMQFLEELFKCIWDEKMTISAVSESAEKLALECAKFSQFKPGEPVPVEIIQFALS